MFDEQSSRSKKHLSPPEAKLKAARFCAYQERSQQEVRDKLYEYGLHYNDVEELLSELIVEGFINEERFARAYVRGKFKMKKWGRHKILQGLKQHKVSEYCIKKGWEEIDPNEYEAVMIKLLEQKAGALKNLQPAHQKAKIASFLVQRGYESEMIWSALNDIY